MEPASQPEPFLAAAKLLGDQIDDAGARTTWFVTWARAAADLSTYRYLFYSADEMQDRTCAHRVCLTWTSHRAVA